MRRPLTASALVVVLALALALGCSEDEAPLGPAAGSPAWHAARVSPDSLIAHVAALSSIHSRFMQYDPGTAAALAYLEETLAGYGLEPIVDGFEIYRGGRWIPTANVEALFPGTDAPGHEVVLGAHWDSIDWPEGYHDSSQVAPGADDNASGVATLLEMARLLRGLPTPRSVRLIFFAGEEVGMYGSRRTRERYRSPAPGDSLICLVNVDMVGHDGDGMPDASLIFIEEGLEMAAGAADLARDLCREIELDTLQVTVGNPRGSSDHLSFWYYDLPAIWLHEGPDDLYEGANTETDTLGVVDPAYLADCARALLGITLHLAGCED